MHLTKELLRKFVDSSALPALVLTPNNLGPDEKCALMVFVHGKGEAGDGTIRQLMRLLSNPAAAGPHPFAAAVDNFQFANPVDGKTHKFMIVSMQGINNWAPFASEIQYAIKHDLLPKYPINPNAVFITGLSAGGKEATDAITSGDAEIFAACIPMSQAGHGQDIKKAVDNNIKVWAFCGDVDYDYKPNADAFVSQMNALRPGIAKKTLYPGGHGGWNNYYDPNYKEEFFVNGKKKALNIYEWALSNMKVDVLPGVGGGTVDKKPTEDVLSNNAGKVDVTKDVIDVVIPVPPFPSETAKTSGVGIIGVPDEMNFAKGTQIVDLDGSQSKGGHGYWNAVSVPPGSWQEAIGPAKMRLRNMKEGNWLVKFTDQDGYNQRQEKLVKINIGFEKTINKFEVVEVYTDGTRSEPTSYLPRQIQITLP